MNIFKRLLLKYSMKIVLTMEILGKFRDVGLEN